jgi:hypothetical protein
MARDNSLTIHSESGICPFRVLILRANCGSKEEMDLARVDYTEDRGSLHLVVSKQFQSRKWNKEACVILTELFTCQLIGPELTFAKIT